MFRPLSNESLDYDELSRNYLTQMVNFDDPKLKEMYKGLLMTHLQQSKSQQYQEQQKSQINHQHSYIPSTTLFSVDGLTRQFRQQTIEDDLPQTLPAISQAIKDLKKEVRENRRLCIEAHQGHNIYSLHAQPKKGESS